MPKSNPSQETEVNKCVQQYLNKFSTYDQSVDVTSCWQAFFNSVEYQKSGAFFDRFPELKKDQSQPSFTPDFTCLLNRDYGMIFEIKTGISNDSSARKKEIQSNILPQIQKYNQPLQFCSPIQIQDGIVKKAEWIQPKNHDIIILTNSVQSGEFADEFFSSIDEAKIQFTRQPIILEFEYSSLTVAPFYYFKRVYHEKNGIFTEPSLNEKLYIKKGSLTISPKYFTPYKLFYFSNDEPPALYTLTRLWMNFFPSFLREERQLATDGIPKSKIPIIVTATELKNYINARIPQAKINEKWIEKALDEAVAAGLAKKEGKQNYIVEYKELQSRPYRDRTDSEEIKSGEKNYVKILAERICKNRATKKAKTPDNTTDERIQPSLFG